MSVNVLIADDSPSVRKFVTFALKMKGYKVIAACDGMDALEKIPQEDFDLIITDLNMPNVDGFELIQTIRSNDSYKQIPIIILTSMQNETEKEKGFSFGANSYLVKPFNVQKIQYEVAKYIN
jgi:two-component system chemotaxis response regulator CheY